MFRFLIVYHKNRKFGNGNFIDYPVYREYYFGQDHYRLMLEKWIPSPKALAEYRLLTTDYDRAIIYTFRLEKHTNNQTDPYWCFYLTCLNRNPHGFGKRQYARYREIGLSGVMSHHIVSKGQSTPYFNNFSLPD